MIAISRLLLGVIAVAASAQTSEKVFYFTNIATPEVVRDATNAIRTVADVGGTPDAAGRSVTVRGTDDQIALAAWMAAELDKAGGGEGKRNFTVNDARAPVAQIVSLDHIDDPRLVQEIINVLRSITEINRAAAVPGQKVLAIRGLESQIEAADWLIRVLDSASEVAIGARPQQYRLPEGGLYVRGGLLIEVARLNRRTAPQDLQAVVNVSRTIADLNRVFPVMARGVLVVRGTEADLTLVNALLAELDGPGGQGMKPLSLPDRRDSVVVSYVNAASPARLQEVVNGIRSGASIARIFAFPPLNAVVMRGTAEQIAVAKRLLP